MARLVIRSTRCDQCISLLTDPENIAPIREDEELSLNYSSATFLDAVNRGGRSKASDYTFTLCINSWRVYKEMQSSHEMTSRFLSSSNQRLLFLQVMDRATTSDDVVLAEDNYCTKGHDLKTVVPRRLSNCLAENLVKDFTNSTNAISEESDKCNRRIKKMQSSNLQRD